jgi:hypothetical protein
VMMMVMVIRSEQILRHQVLFVGIKYFHRIYCRFSLHITKMCLSSHAPSRKCQMTFTGHSIIVGPQGGTCYISHFWHLLYGGGCRFVVDRWTLRDDNMKQNSINSGQHVFIIPQTILISSPLMADYPTHKHFIAYFTENIVRLC